MEIPFRIRFIIEVLAALACAYSLAKYGFLPVGIILGVLIMIFSDVLFLDKEDLKK
ncbi:MAG: hypothetical protein Q8Q48_00490 [Candidatus Staskawiczbacteria bacterium]|nr:hypothetical protein [Candidatus Staskawiczbacteria bacterium]